MAPLEDDPSYKTYMQELNNLHAAIQIFKNGVQDELEELKIVQMIREQLAEAVKFTSSEARVVSMSEFAKLKKDLMEIDRQVEAKRLAVERIETIVKERSKQIDLIAKKMEGLKKKFENANIINFRKKE